MICTKAYITALPEEGSNIFKVNVPLMIDNVSDEAIFDALLCYNEGNYNGLKVGDPVFVDFEDDKYNIAIILGKLYTDVPEENAAYGLYNQLNVTGSAVLPENTKIGNYTPQDIFNLYQGIQNGGGINPDDLKPYVRWEYTEESEESGEEPTSEDLRLFAHRMRIDHLHWKAPNVPMNDDGEYIDSEGNVILPDSKDMQMFAQTRRVNMIQFDPTGDEPDPEQPDERVYADFLKIMTGEDYDSLEERDEHTLFCLTSVPPSEDN